MTGEIIAILSLVAIVGSASLYIIKAKKSGRKCIGCPNGGTCNIKKLRKDVQDAKEHCCCCSKDKEI